MHALRQVQAAYPVRPASGTAAARSTGSLPARTPAAQAGPAPASLWQRLLGLVGDFLKGLLDVVRSGVDAVLRTLGAHK